MPIAGLDVAFFLRDHWQKKPLVIRQALPGFRDPLEPEELAGLACEDCVESRLVFTRGSRWEMRNGPFVEKDFTSLPERDWTLLVQSVDQWLPALKQLFRLVDFLPAWRRDDLLVSFATPGAGAGPHFDFYDVFILQGKGSREWKLGQHCTPETPLATDSGLKILRDFEAKESVVLHSGDLLYIPPGVAHHGVSLDNSLSYSIGFRAPSVADMLIGVSDELAAGMNEHQRFVDSLPGLNEGGLINPQAVSRVSQTLIRTLEDNPAAITRWFGSLMTSPRLPDAIAPPETPLSDNQLEALIEQQALYLNPCSRVAYAAAPSEESRLLVFHDGETASLASTPDALALLELLATHLGDQAPDLRSALGDSELFGLIVALVERGTLENLDDDAGE